MRRPSVLAQRAAFLLVIMAGCSSRGFVSVQQGKFIQDDAPHVVAGVNFWQALNMAIDDEDGDRARLRRELDHLARLGLTNLRILAGSEGPNGQPYRVSPAMQSAPGEYDERLLDALDFLLYEMDKRNMHAVMVLTNFWEWSGGMAQYVSWSEKTAIPYPAENDWREFCRYAARFYDSPQCQQWYRDHIRTIIERVNRYNGRSYRADPTIFSWELANEPRYYPPTWIAATAGYIKSLDPNHMVTTGSEGRIGGEFVPSHESDAIDYATIHIWPQNWGWFDPKDLETTGNMRERTAAYLEEHFQRACDLNKPVVVE
ncbi:MAG: glycoside hydrolase 5 family protein, partial [Planctomycetota bacterium]